MNTQRIALDVTKRRTTLPEIRLGQGDRNGTVLEIEVYDDGTPLDLDGYDVRFAMMLPNRHGYYDCDGEATDNLATFEIDEGYAAASAGVTETAYMEVLDGDDVICSTGRFRIVVLESAVEGVEPTSIYDNGLEDAIAAAEQAVEDLDEDLSGYVTQWMEDNDVDLVYTVTDGDLVISITADA